MAISDNLYQEIRERLKFDLDFTSWMRSRAEVDPPRLMADNIAGPFIKPVSLACSASLTLTTAFQDVAGCSAVLGPGTYVVWGVFDMFHSLNGGGVATGSLNVGGTIQAGNAVLFNTGSANGDRATVAQMWIFSITSALTVKLQAAKTINAGTAQAISAATKMMYVQIA